MRSPKRLARAVGVVEAFFFLAVFASNAPARPASIWVGGHSENWSDPLNWAGSVPTNGEVVYLQVGTSGPSHIFQDITGGVLLSGLESFPFSTSNSFLIDGNRINLTANARIKYHAPPAWSQASLNVRAPVRLLGDTTFENAATLVSSNYAQLFHEVSGGGSVTSLGQATFNSDTVILNPNYTGTTTVESGVLRIGGAALENSNYVFYHANSSNQGNYLIMDGATLTGMGAIGLAPDAGITVAGTLVPGAGVFLGIGEDGGSSASMTVRGDVVVADGGRVGANWLGDFAQIIVDGTLDLRGVGDRLSIYGPVNFAIPHRTYVAIKYQNRLGSFDVPPLPTFFGAVMTYTSPENSGPGEVLITFTFPEPSGAACALPTALLAMETRRRKKASVTIRA